MRCFSRNMIICSAFLSMSSVVTLTYAREVAGAGGAGVRAGLSAIATKAQAIGVAPSNAAPASGVNISEAAQAQAVPCKIPTLRDGWYIGAQAGYGAYRIQSNINFLAGAPLYDMNPVTANSNWSIGGVIGYGKMLNQWFYLGGELSIVANTMEEELYVTNLVFPYLNQSAAGPTYGIGLLPGIKLTSETLVYVRLGWNRAIVKTTETLSTLTPVNVSKILNGFAVGVGIETLMTSDYSVRCEYGHLFLGSYNTTGYFNTRVNPSYNGFALTFIYHA